MVSLTLALPTWVQSAVTVSPLPSRYACLTECPDNQCSSDIANSRAICNRDGTCDFSCLGNTVFDGTTCAGMVIAPRCSFDRQCSTSIENATGICFSGRCSFTCAPGFFASGSTCAASAQTCGGQECPSVPYVLAFMLRNFILLTLWRSGGYNTCENNVCVARCEAQLGYKQYCNADNTSCQCVQTDVGKFSTPLGH